MRKLFRGRKRYALVSAIMAVVVSSAVAFAFFVTLGSGTGSAKTEKASTLSIKQIGAGYDSLITTNTYIQDQAFFGPDAGIMKVGDRVALAGTTAEQLVTVVVAIRNWSHAVTGQSLTFTIQTTVAGPVTDTQSFTFPAALVTGVDPSVTNVVFDFASQGAVIDHSFLYTISGLNGTSLNLALSNSYSDTAVGTDTTVGYLYVEASGGGWTSLGNDFPSCSTPISLTALVKVDTACGHQSPTNPGAYGTATEVDTTGNADIPAIEVNVVGGTAPGLYPGGPAQPVNFAIFNKGQTSVHVHQVTSSISSLSTTGSTGSIPACTAGTYAFYNTPATVNRNVPPGTTLISPSGTQIYMSTNGANQNNCQGAVVKLHFASN